jgi:hypothetical protein
MNSRLSIAVTLVGGVVLSWAGQSFATRSEWLLLLVLSAVLSILLILILEESR